MKTLEEHNRDVADAFRLPNCIPIPNNIECPKCGKELLDTDPTVMLPSIPPQKNVHCPDCGYRGYALL